MDFFEIISKNIFLEFDFFFGFDFGIVGNLDDFWKLMID